MSDAVVGAPDAGRTCPYCRFALKQGVAACRCDACGALHHADCWADGGGCAVLGCAGAADATAVMALPAAAPAPAPSAGVAAPAGGAPPPVPAAPAASDRRMVLGIAVGLAVAAAGIGGYLVAHGDDGGGGSAAQVVTGTTTQGSTAVAPPPSVDPQDAAMRELATIVSLSQQGRTAVTQGRYLDAVDNRELVLRRLDAIEGAEGEVEDARRLLHSAMEASLAADRAYAANGDPSASDALATERKRAFVAQWNGMAGRYGLETYAEGQI
jgi:hypothetical protein